MDCNEEKKVFYIGFYDGSLCSKKRMTEKNIAATMKMNFIIESLKSAGYHVTIISLAIGNNSGIFLQENVHVDDMEEQIFPTYASIRFKSHYIGASITIKEFLKKYLVSNVTANDTVISYHSLFYGDLIEKKRDEIGFTWISEIEEIYCLSRADLKDVDYLDKEIAQFENSDKFIFSNDCMADVYAKGKPFVVVYGNYKVFIEKEIYNGDKIGIVYTGIVNDDRGVFRVIDAMKYLPEEYTLGILGFGSPENMEHMHNAINKVNDLKSYECIKFYGTMTGDKYTEFISKYQIGTSLMDISNDVAYNAFPSKILAYLGHSLFVVSSKAMCVEKSRVADLLYFSDNDPKDIANTIMRIKVHEKNNAPERLMELKSDFVKEISNLMEAPNKRCIK